MRAVKLNVTLVQVWMICTRVSVCSVHGHSDLAALVKGSPYFQGLLPLPAECWDMDGDHTTLPVIFEDVYCEASVAKHREYFLCVCVCVCVCVWAGGWVDPELRKSLKKTTGCAELSTRF